MNLGSIYKDFGKLDQALASTRKSLELKPDNPDALMNLGDIYNELQISDLALEAYAKAYELKPNISNACRAKLFFPWTFNDQDDIDKLRYTYIKNAEKIFNNDIQ